MNIEILNIITDKKNKIELKSDNYYNNEYMIATLSGILINNNIEHVVAIIPKYTNIEKCIIFKDELLNKKFPSFITYEERNAIWKYFYWNKDDICYEYTLSSNNESIINLINLINNLVLINE